MKSIIMNHIFEKILNLSKSIKHSLKFQSDWYEANTNMLNAIEEGDWNKFEKNYSLKNKYLDFTTLATKIAINGDYNLYKNLEKKGLEDNKIVDLFYANCFEWSIIHNNIEIVKDIYQNKSQIVSFSSASFKLAVDNQADDILNFMLYDLNYQIDADLNIWLNMQQKYYEIMEKVEKRNLLYSLNNDLITQETKHKTHKI